MNAAVAEHVERWLKTQPRLQPRNDGSGFLYQLSWAIRLHSADLLQQELGFRLMSTPRWRWLRRFHFERHLRIVALVVMALEESRGSRG